MVLLVFTAFMRRVDAHRAHEDAPEWMWELVGLPMQFVCMAGLVGCFAAACFTDERDRGWTYLVNLPPLLLLWLNHSLSW